MGTASASGDGDEERRLDLGNAAQRRYLERGLTQAGGKLPLFDRDGREISKRTVESCVANGWATPWVHNPIKPDWLVCRLTEAGYRVLGSVPPPDLAAQPVTIATVRDP